MKRLIAIAVAALCATTYAGTDEDAGTAMREAEARKRTAEARGAEARARIEEARAQIADAAKVMAEAAKLQRWTPGRAFLGVLIAAQGEDGIHVAGISPDSGAAEAGIQADDIIVAINDESLVGDDRPVEVLHGVLADVEPGDGVRLLLLREGEELDLDVTTTPYLADSGLHHFRWWGDLDEVEIPSFSMDSFAPRRWRRSGLRLADIGEDLGEYFGVDAGVLVLDTPAKSELKPGDILKRIDGAAVSSAEDAYRLLRRLQQDAQAEVRRKNRKVTVDVAASKGAPGKRSRVLFFDRGDEEEEEEDQL